MRWRRICGDIAKIKLSMNWATRIAFSGSEALFGVTIENDHWQILKIF
jgi:hypothetical protein